MTRPHFLGTDASQSPLVPELHETAKALAARGATEGAVSARYGLRAVVNPVSIPLDMVGPDHFVEIADYDPHTDQLLCLGPHAPHRFAALHALVYRAKKEVGAIVDVELPATASVPGDAPRVEAQATTLDTAMAVLEALRGADAVMLGERRFIATGLAPREARKRAEDALSQGEA